MNPINYMYVTLIWVPASPNVKVIESIRGSDIVAKGTSDHVCFVVDVIWKPCKGKFTLFSNAFSIEFTAWQE